MKMLIFLDTVFELDQFLYCGQAKKQKVKVKN